MHRVNGPVNFDLLYIYSMPYTCSRSSKHALITYFCLFAGFDVSSGSSVDHASGGVGGVLASFTTIVKECYGSFFLIIHGWSQASNLALLIGYVA